MGKKLIKQTEVQKRHNMIYRIPNEIVPEFIEDCLSSSFFARADILDCSKSIQRKPSPLSLNEATELIKKSPQRYYTFILRNGGWSQFEGDDTKYFEFCASGMKESVEHFVWIEIKEEDGNRLIEKYKLKKKEE